MSVLGPILGMAAGLYSLRLAGFLLSGTAAPATWERTLGFVPVAMLSALVVAGLAGHPNDAPLRLVAIGGAGLAVRQTGQVWVGILAGMALYALLRLA